MTKAWHAAWESALDELELSVETAEQILSGGVLPEMPAWQPPQLPCALPAELLPRAQLLLQRQTDTLRRTAEAASQARRQLALTDKLDAAPARRAVYLDVSA